MQEKASHCIVLVHSHLFEQTPHCGDVPVSPDFLMNSLFYLQLTVAAIDSGAETRQTSTTTLTVDITDVNNKPPKFNQVG